MTLDRLAGALADGTVTARSLVERSLRRIEQHSSLGAVVALRAEEALAEADAVDRARSRGDVQPPLAGVPFLAKDHDDLTGLRTTQGSRWFADAGPATRDGLIVSRLRAAGAIPVGKTNVPEFCIEGFTDNLVFGATRNPWNPELSPGGSSGGSAAALAAGLAPIATGADGGGSVRIPAAFCGLLGYKPTAGLIVSPVAPDWIDFSTDGFMTTSVADLRTLRALLIGGEAPPARTPRKLVVADRTDPLGPLPEEVRTAFHRAAERLADVLEAPVDLREPESFFPGWSPDEDWFVIATAEHAQRLGRERILAHADDLHPSSRDFLLAGLEVGIDEYIAARRRRHEAIVRLDEVLADDAILVTPTVAVAGYTADGRVGDGPSGLLGPEVYSTAVQNMTGVPAISLPAGRLSNGLPFGLQITAARGADESLVDIARAWEQAHPWPLAAGRYTPFEDD